jgi:predicted DNA binding CopG/RHH family protein
MPGKSITMKAKSKILKRLPRLSRNRAVEHFVADGDLGRYDLSSMRLVKYELAPKEARINMRLPGALLDAVKVAARRQGMPYQRFVRQALERAVQVRS